MSEAGAKCPVKLEEAKNYLRVDLDDDDALIVHCLNMAYVYLINAIDDFEQKLAQSEYFAREVHSAILLIMAQMYNHREGEEGEFPPFLRYLISQLQVMVIPLADRKDDADDKAEQAQSPDSAAETSG